MIEIETVDKFKLQLAKLLNFLWYRSKIRIFRTLSNNIAFGIKVKVDNLIYVITTYSDIYEILPGYESKIFDILEEIVKRSNVFIDVGAHIGRYTFPIAKKHSNLNVIAIEPDPNSYKALIEGIKLNGLNNVIALNLALGERDGHEFLCRKHSTAISSITEREECWSTVKIPVQKLDTLVKKLSLTSVDIIKIDSEGSEVMILKGAKNTLERFIPYILVEVRRHNYSKFKNFVDSLLYRCEPLITGSIDDVFYCYPK